MNREEHRTHVSVKAGHLVVALELLKGGLVGWQATQECMLEMVLAINSFVQYERERAIHESE